MCACIQKTNWTSKKYLETHAQLNFTETHTVTSGIQNVHGQKTKSQTKASFKTSEGVQIHNQVLFLGSDLL